MPMVVACFCCFFFLLGMALFTTLNHTFRKRRRKMDIAVWESIFISIKIDDDGVDSPQQEINVDVPKNSGVIHIEYVHVERILEKNRYIRFEDIQRIRTPTINSIMLDLEDGNKVTLIFGTKAARDDFHETITIVSSDSRNSEES